MVEHLLEVLRISDDLHHIRLAMKCFPRLYGQTLETSPPNHKYLTKFLPRVIYLLRIFYEHSNLLNPQKVFLKDYFNYNQQDLVLRFTTPTVLTESYQRLQTNLKHSPLPAQAPDAQVSHIEKCSRWSFLTSLTLCKAAPAPLTWPRTFFWLTNPLQSALSSCVHSGKSCGLGYC
jgi:hypothetical protein